jgi:hypothetical protein
MFQNPWMAIWPGLALSIVVYGVNMFGDALRDILDPRLTGGGGRFGVKLNKNPQLKENSAPQRISSQNSKTDSHILTRKM